MNKEKYFIDLSKLSEEQQKHVFSLLPRFQRSFADIHFTFLHSTNTGIWYCDNAEGVRNKTELTYPDFIKLFEGGEGEKYSHDEIKKLAIERYGDDINSFGGQRDGFIEGFKKAMELNSNQ